MKVASSVLVILMVNGAEAFFVAPARPSTTQLSLYRQAYQYSLEQMADTGKVEVNGFAVEPEEAAEMMDKEIEAAQEESAKAEVRRSSADEQLQALLVEQTTNVQAMQAEVQKQAAMFQSNFDGMHGSRDTSERLQDHQNSMVAIQQMKDREIAIKEEIAGLSAQVDQEESNIRANKETSNNIFDSRINLDSELEVLKERYDAKSVEWKAKLQEERAAHERDVASSQGELDQLQREINALQTEQKLVNLSEAQADALREKLNNAQLISNRILQTRVEIDGELGALKRKYENDYQKWEKKLVTEVSVKETEAKKAQIEVKKLKEEMEKMTEERNDFGSLIARSFKVLFGGN